MVESDTDEEGEEVAHEEDQEGEVESESLRGCRSENIVSVGCWTWTTYGGAWSLIAWTEMG